MIYFTSDLHLGHANILSLCDRPFQTVEEMDAALVANWNRRVKKKDTVYVLGDVVWDKRKLAHYMERLAGKKILVTGNHDSTWARREEARVYFETVVPYLEISHYSHSITLCHYPMLEWKESRETLPHKLGYHIHGHIHNRVSDEYRSLYTCVNALNAGVDINGYAPVTFNELISNNNAFKLAALSSPEDRERLLRDIQAIEM